MAAPCPLLHAIFRKSASDFPDRIAVDSPEEGLQLTYSRLDLLSNGLAQAFQESLGVREGDCVGLLLHKSAELYLYMLAVLKAGAAVVFLDPENPPQRLITLVLGSGVRYLLHASQAGGGLWGEGKGDGKGKNGGEEGLGRDGTLIDPSQIFSPFRHCVSVGENGRSHPSRESPGNFLGRKDGESKDRLFLLTPQLCRALLKARGLGLDLPQGQGEEGGDSSETCARNPLTRPCQKAQTKQLVAESDPSQPKASEEAHLQASRRSPEECSRGRMERQVLSPSSFRLPYLKAQTERAADSEAQTDVSSIAYVFFTSGSSGKPKGVALAHHCLANFVLSYQMTFKVTPGDRVVQALSLSFDASLEEIWLAFTAGATLVVCPIATLRIGAFGRFCETHSVTVTSTVPMALQISDHIPSPPILRILLVGGETCPPSLVASWAHPSRRLVNSYGPTEATCAATVCDLKPGEPVSIGGMLPGYGLAIRPVGLDHNNGIKGDWASEEGSENSSFASGELCIGGVSVAKGYLLDGVLQPWSSCSSPSSSVLGGGFVDLSDVSGKSVCLPVWHEYDWREIVGKGKGEKGEEKECCTEKKIVERQAPTESTVPDTVTRSTAENLIAMAFRWYCTGDIVSVEGVGDLKIFQERERDGKQSGDFRRAGGVPNRLEACAGELAWAFLPESENLRLIFHGRADSQVKIRGHRIECGEVAASLCWHPVVKNAVVTARKDSGEASHACALVAFVVTASPQQRVENRGENQTETQEKQQQKPQEKSLEPSAAILEEKSLLSSELMCFARTQMPHYMVPSRILILSQPLPLTPSGKVDYLYLLSLLRDTRCDEQTPKAEGTQDGRTQKISELQQAVGSCPKESEGRSGKGDSSCSAPLRSEGTERSDSHAQSCLQSNFEVLVASEWEKILGLRGRPSVFVDSPPFPCIRPTDNFFLLGGSSLSVSRFVNSIRHMMPSLSQSGVASARAVYETPLLRSLCIRMIEAAAYSFHVNVQEMAEQQDREARNALPAAWRVNTHSVRFADQKLPLSTSQNPNEAHLCTRTPDNRVKQQAMQPYAEERNSFPLSHPPPDCGVLQEESFSLSLNTAGCDESAWTNALPLPVQMQQDGKRGICKTGMDLEEGMTTQYGSAKLERGCSTEELSPPSVSQWTRYLIWTLQTVCIWMVLTIRVLWYCGLVTVMILTSSSVLSREKLQVQQREAEFQGEKENFATMIIGGLFFQLSAGTLFSLLSVAIHLMTAVLVKTFAVGPTREGDFPVWGGVFFRRWLLQLVTRGLPLGSWMGTPIFPFVLRLFGCSVGQNVYIEGWGGCDECGVDLYAVDLVRIGSNTTIGLEARVDAVELRGSSVRIRKIHIGQGCEVRSRAIIGPGAFVGDLNVVEEGCMLSGETERPADTHGITWADRPGKVKGRKPFKERREQIEATKKAMPPLSRKIIFTIGVMLWSAVLEAFSLLPVCFCLYWNRFSLENASR
uniref:AMP-dependent synthetase/ligase domain-containing protein n=1 Tax=Chromera velia CCMP2878 TaxID=1169474 RepID=A0A0G4IES9_9ALVE|eukprot:Cvel_13812.t1-p1 / transcript=Cvel_13812.t1 / gene=Cvel_13812 / organism=Chromera_velia_CCMP2878 / gene_product=Chondramide synthase cmdD, putative / transcript_product=Chondramide synthase cmdD, putative / location=Cvel_scaffold958:42702-49010(+) / protein_length=1471 / sequence_SO=supercontig / SO=protein_coding / is_pseudo=false